MQLREKSDSDRSILLAAEKLAELCQELSVPFFVNDRADLALLSGADGVHIGQDDVDIERMRNLLGKEFLIGLSTHTPEEFDRANTSSADYLSVGPIVETPTKPGRTGTGLDYLRYASVAASKPFFVTGGVTPSEIPRLQASGASRFVVVRYLTESGNSAAAASELVSAMGAAEPSL